MCESDGATLEFIRELAVLLLLIEGRELDGGYFVEALLEKCVSFCHYLYFYRSQTFWVVKAVLEKQNFDESGELYFDVPILQNALDVPTTLLLSSNFSPYASKSSPLPQKHI